MRALVAAFALMLAATGASPCFAQDRPNAPAAELDPAQLALAREVVDLAIPPETRHAMLTRVGETMAAQMRDALFAGHPVDAGVQAIFQRYLERVRSQTEPLITEYSPAIFAAVARAYARNFTRDELLQIRAFMATPAGARYIQRSPELLADPDIAQANTAYFRRAMTVLEPLQADLRRELTEYMAHHPR
jgi:hypothetical protein